MEHFFNRKPTKGYTELTKDFEKTQHNRHVTDEMITVPNHIAMAACYVEDARDGRLANGKGKMSEKTRKIQLCFFIQTHAWWSKFIYLSIVFMSILIFFEPPSSAAITVCSMGILNYSKNNSICQDETIIQNWEAWTLFVEFLLIMIFVTDVFMKATYMKPSTYFTKKWQKVTTFFILMFSIDWILFVCTYYAMNQKGLRFSRPFRPVLLLTRNRELRRILETITRMLSDLIKLTALLLIFVFLFAWLGVTFFGKIYRFTTNCADKTFGDVAPNLNESADYCVTNICWDVDKYPFCLCGEGEEDPKTGCSNDVQKFTTHYITSSEAAVYNGSFSNPFIAMVRLVVLISTENYPDVMLPAYKITKLSVLYFGTFLMVGMFLLLSVLLAVIVEFWLSYLRKTNDSEKRKERLGITKAFIWIDTQRTYHIKEHQWNELVLLLKKDFTKLQSHFMFQMLDWEQKDYLDVLDFLYITEALKLHYTLKDADTAIENTEIGQFARRILSYYFNFSCFGLIKPAKIVNVTTVSVIFSLLHTLLSVVHGVDLIPEAYIIARTTINTVLLLVLLSEVLLRIMASGSGFFHPLTNKWEVFSITVAFVCMVGYWITYLSALKKSAQDSYTPTPADLFRTGWEFCIFFRLSLHYNTIRGQLVFFYKVLMVLLELFFFIIIIVYVFLGLGLEFFAIADAGSEENYFEEYDCKLGFINPICGLLTLFQLITTSNWHSVMNPVYKASGEWAFLYFIMFYLVIDLVLLDLMIAIAIEMYNAVRNQDSEEAFGDQPGICFEVYEGQIPEPPQPTTATSTSLHPVAKPERRRSRLGSIFNTNGANPPQPYRKLILEVTRSKKGSWRQSILTSEIYKIESEEIEAIQKSLDKDYKHHNDHDHQKAIEVKLLYSEKGNERIKLNKPDCKLYIKSMFMDIVDPKVARGKILMELNDNQSALHFKLIFKSDSKPIAGVFKYDDGVNCEQYFELDEGEFAHHIHTDDYHVYKHWRMRRIQKQNFIQGQVSFLIMTQDQPDGAMQAIIDNVAAEKQKWLQRKDMIQQNAETFGKISPLLSWFAHRVTTKVMKDEESDDEDENGSVEDGDLKKEEFRRKIYVPNEYKADTKFVNEAHREWCSMYQKEVPETMGDSTAAVLNQVKNFMVNQNTLAVPPGGNANCYDDSSSEDDDDDDDDDDDEEEATRSDDDKKPGLQIGGGANKLKGLFEAIASVPERRLSSNSRRSSSSSYRSQRSNRSSRSQPTPTSHKPSLVIPQVINTDHDEELAARGSTSPDGLKVPLTSSSSAPASPCPSESRLSTSVSGSVIEEREEEDPMTLV